MLLDWIVQLGHTEEGLRIDCSVVVLILNVLAKSSFPGQTARPDSDVPSNNVPLIVFTCEVVAIATGMPSALFVGAL